MYEKNGNIEGSTGYNIFFATEVFLCDRFDVKNDKMSLFAVLPENF